MSDNIRTIWRFPAHEVPEFMKSTLFGIPKPERALPKHHIVHTVNGKTLTQTQWAHMIGIMSSSISKRIKLGWSVEEACTRPITRNNQWDKPTEARL
jgi:hypothetical protein